MTEKGKNNFICQQALRPTRSTCGCLCDDVDMILYTKRCNRALPIKLYTSLIKMDSNLEHRVGFLESRDEQYRSL
jgi:hypothetical protein